MKEVKEKLSKKDRFGVWVRWLLFYQACYNYEVYQGIGLAHALSQAMKKLYPSKQRLAEELSKYSGFFNTSTHIGGIAVGVVLALEESRALGNKEVTPELITSVKTGLMGPLAGIGDSVIQGVIIPIFLSIAIVISEKFGLIGPIFYILTIVPTILSIGYISFSQGYRFGAEAISRFIASGRMQKFLGFSGVVASLVLGGVVSRFINISSSFHLVIGTNDFILQTDFFDILVPNFLSISVVCLIYFLLKKGFKSQIIIIVIFIVGILLAIFGILGPVPVRS